MTIIERISRDLNDPDHITWPVRDLQAWVKEAIGIAVTIAPEAFKRRKVVEVEPCTEYQEVPCCDFIFSVLGESTKDGRITNRLRKATTWMGEWPQIGCTPSRSSGLKRYYITGEKDLYLAPALPPGTTTYIVVECTSRDDVDPDNLPPNVDVAIIMWVLYRARSMDAESSVVGDMGERDYQKMKDLLSKFKGEIEDGQK